MNRTSVSWWRSVSPAWRGQWRGPLLCSALVATALASFVFLRPRESLLRPSQSFRNAAHLSISAAANRNAEANFASGDWALEPNVGQSAPCVKFLARANDSSVFLTSDSLYISWSHIGQMARARSPVPSDFLRLQFMNANSAAAASGEALLPGKTNYLIGRNSRDWHTNVPHFRAVRYAGLYPGVDARFYGGPQSLEYDLIASPRSDLNRIRLRATGANALHTDAQGDLLIKIGARDLIMKRPQIYQIQNGVRVRISGGYRLLAANEIGFEIGKHRSDLPLIIDPTISIAYTTFLGGSGQEKGNSVAVDSFGKIYVGGTTTLAPFPSETATLADNNASATSTLFAAKIDPTQSGAASLIYLTFIGGSLSNQGGMVAVDSSASPPNLAILGWTTSPDFPVTNNSALNGPSDLTVTDLNGSGDALVYSEYFGGSGAEATQGAGGIATDSSGDVFITSDTASADFPVMPPMNTTFGGGGSDGVLVVLAARTGALRYAACFGINAATVGSTSVAVDASGNAYVAGFTSSPTTFPAVNPFQASYGGGNFDAFVMELNSPMGPPPPPGSSSIVYASLLGGSQSDQALSIAVDTANPANAYVTGLTQSPDLIPSSGVTNSPFQSSLGTGAAQNGFFAVINQSGGTPSLQYITYLGGSGTDAAQSVAIVSPTRVYVAGTATSTNFPSLCTLQAFSGTQDAFVAEFNPTVSGSSSLLSANFLGGTATAEANAITTDSSGDAILFGDTLSSDYPLAGNPQNGFQTICSSCQSSPAESDAFLTTLAIGTGTSGCVAFAPLAGNFGSFADGTSAPPLNVQVTNVGDGNLNVSSVRVTGTNSTDFSAPLQNDSCIANSPIAPGGTCNFSVIFTPSVIGPETAALQISDDGVGSPQSLNLNGTGTAVGVSLSPGSSLNFPNTPQGGVSAEQAITLTNTSSDPLLIPQSPSLQGSNPTDFEFGSSNTCVVSNSTPIVPGSTCTIALQFAPNELNPPAGGEALSAQEVLTLQDQTNNSTQTITIALNGTEVPAMPAIVFSPTALVFSSENVGSATASQPLTITNTGSAALAISSITITGTNPGDFLETNTCPISPQTVAINGSCTVSVTFQPTATGPRSANVSVSDNAASSPQTVALSGTGTAAGVSLTPSSLIFAGQNPGTPPSPPQPVTLQNTGTGPLTISSISITGADPSDFNETDNCPKSGATLNLNQACSIAVTFAPTATGTRSASLSVTDNAVPSPQTVSFSGLGTAPGAQINVSTIPFAPAVVGSQSAVSPAQVSNPGNGPLTISSISFTGADPADFRASGSCIGSNGAGVIVAAGSNCTLNVVFAPTAAGVRSATLNVNDNAASSPQQVSTSGIATDFQLAVAASGSTSVTISAGETATFNLQASSINGFSGTLAMSCADPIPASTCTISPSQVSVPNGQTTPFTAAITTTAHTSFFVRPFFTKRPPRTRNVLFVGFGLLAFGLLSLWRRRYVPRRFRLAFLLTGALLLCSCGGGNSSPSSNGTPAGNYTVTVNGAISGATHSLPLSLTVQ